ncbi:hypothetical protein M404DRAFT_992166 [Pisolithus tinctorius Marx 270]|uniref:Uncharacterized protein n=1 Tax=Pisolithus tinctorius Marx 270 TaxID=870435 RepID=A0A0C3PX07_PISTI|nr:hypothetical protein M404DRAFT_992166 [Pisolithus tinctorius Marx 270]
MSTSEYLLKLAMLTFASFWSSARGNLRRDVSRNRLSVRCAPMPDVSPVDVVIETSFAISRV